MLLGLKNKCKTLCRPRAAGTEVCDAARAYDEIWRGNDWPYCEGNQTNCYHEILLRAQEDLKDSSGLCDKLNFRIKHAKTYPYHHKRPGLSALFEVVLDPPKIVVNEEYLIYDMVAFISSIGGTLGICIGFSFTGFASSFLRCFERLSSRVRHDLNSSLD